MKILRQSLLLCISLFMLSGLQTSLYASEFADALDEATEDVANRLSDDVEGGLSVAEKDAIKNTLKDSLKGMSEDTLKESGVANAAIRDASDELVSSLSKSMGDEGDISDAISKLSGDSDALQNISSAAHDGAIDRVENLADRGFLPKDEAGEMLDGLKESQSALDGLDSGSDPEDQSRLSEDGEDDTESRVEDKALGSDEFDAIGDLLDEDGNLKESEEGDTPEDKEKESLMDRWDKLKETAPGRVISTVGEQLVMFAFMTVPQLIQQSVESELARVAQLRSVARPAQFGDWVVQVVDDCIDKESPQNSVPLYSLIPVSSVGVSVSSEIAKAFGNTIADEKAYSLNYFGHTTKRYDVKAGYHKYGRFAMSYPSSSFTDFGSEPSMITSPEFSGFMADINQGYVVDATGEESVSPPQPPLIPMKGNVIADSNSPVKAISVALPGIYSKLKSAGLTSTYSAFGGTSNGPDVKGNVLSYFDVDSQTGQSAVKGGLSVLEKSLDAYSAGQVFGKYDESGNFMKGVFGTILPMFGWGDDYYQKIINKQSFPDNVSLSANQSGVIVDDVGSTKGANNQSASSVRQYAKAANYGPEGCWVYICSDSPFAKAVQQGTLQNSGKGPFVDYVIFLDDSANQVPAFAPVPRTISTSSTGGFSGKLDTIIGNLMNDLSKKSTPVLSLNSQLQDIKGAIPSGVTMPKSLSVDLQTINKESMGTTMQSKVTPGQLLMGLDELRENLKSVNGNSDSSQDNTTDEIKWPVVSWNPKAQYMVSLISSQIEQFSDSSGQPVGYDPQGNEAQIPNIKNITETALSNLEKDFPLLYSQFKSHKNALMSKYNLGPFVYGNTDLQEARVGVRKSSAGKVAGFSQSAGSKAEFLNLQTTGGQTVLRVYGGHTCLGTSGSKVVQDILIAEDSNSSPVSLPSGDVKNFISLVTDITYEVQKDKSLKPSKSVGFEHAPGTWNGKAFTPDNAKKDDLYWLPLLSKLYTQQKVTFNDSYDMLKAYVQQQRDAWFANFDDNQLVQGVDVGSLTLKLASELDSQSVESNNFYVYEVMPSPSATLTNKDWFVAVDFSQPSLSTLELVNVAENKQNVKSLVSLVTGNVYTTTGRQQLDRNGHPVVLSVRASVEAETIGQDIYEYLERVYGDQKGMSSQFAQAYKSAVDNYATVTNRPIMQGSFGGIYLGIYAGDLAMKNFVYFDTSGLTSSESFEPTDLFVTVNPVAGKSPQMGKPFSSTTQYIMSLVSGQVYDKNGPKMVMPIATVSAYAKSQGNYWRAWLKDTIAKLQVAYNAQQKAEAQEKEAFEKDANVSDERLTWTETDIAEIISRLRNVKKLPIPYSSLKKDPIKQIFVRVAQAKMNNQDVSSYTFFNVSNTYKDADGKTVQMGAVYSQEGKLIFELKGAALQAMMDQYGLYGETKETLGVPTLQPSLIMQEGDKSLTPGKSGSSMISSSSSDFPGSKVQLPSGYYLYYSLIMKNYYVLDKKNQQWVDVLSGNVYSMNGHPVAARQEVAINKGGKNDYLLLEEDNAGRMEGYMKNPFNKDQYVKWNNKGNKEWMSAGGSGKAQVVESSTSGVKASAYTVTFDSSSQSRNQKRSYKVDKNYYWEDLLLLPIDDDGQIVTSADMPSSNYRKVRIVKNKGTMKYLMFGNVMYQVSKSSGKDGYEMMPLDSKSAPSIMVEILVDEDTNAPYVRVSTASSQGNKVYKYCYLHKTLSADEFSSMQTAIFKGTVVTCPSSMPVGPMVQKSEDGVSVTHPTSRTYTLFIKDIPSVNSMKEVSASDILEKPDSDSSVYQTFEAMLFRVHQSVDGRYFADMYKNDGQSIHEPFVSYFDRDGYVDIQTGALFDKYGNAVGTSLALDDWLAVLNKLQVTVNRTKDGKSALFYRKASVIKTQQDQQEDDTSEQESQPSEQSAPKAKSMTDKVKDRVAKKIIGVGKDRGQEIFDAAKSKDLSKMKEIGRQEAEKSAKQLASEALKRNKKDNRQRQEG